MWWQSYAFGVTHAKREQCKRQAARVLIDNKTLDMHPSWQWSPKLWSVEILILRAIQIMSLKFIFFPAEHISCKMFFFWSLHSGHVKIKQSLPERNTLSQFYYSFFLNVLLFQVSYFIMEGGLYILAGSATENVSYCWLRPFFGRESSEPV